MSVDLYGHDGWIELGVESLNNCGLYKLHWGSCEMKMQLKTEMVTM